MSGGETLRRIGYRLGLVVSAAYSTTPAIPRCSSPTAAFPGIHRARGQGERPALNRAASHESGKIARFLPSGGALSCATKSARDCCAKSVTVFLRSTADRCAVEPAGPRRIACIALRLRRREQKEVAMRRSSNLVRVLATVGLMGFMAISACKSSDQSSQRPAKRRQVFLNQRRRATCRRRRNGAPATPALPRAATERPLFSGSTVRAATREES